MFKKMLISKHTSACPAVPAAVLITHAAFWQNVQYQRHPCSLVFNNWHWLNYKFFFSKIKTGILVITFCGALRINYRQNYFNWLYVLFLIIIKYVLYPDTTSSLPWLLGAPALCAALISCTFLSEMQSKS